MKNSKTKKSKELRIKKDSLEDIINKTIASLSGFFASERKMKILSVGRILQAMTAGNFLSQLLEEWKEYREMGYIRKDYFQTEQCRASLQVLLDFLDKDSPDKERFNAMKAIFLSSAAEKISDRESVLPLQLMKICRGLDSGEILVLKIAYSQTRGKKHKNRKGKLVYSTSWLKEVVEKTGLGCSELVEIYEKKLIEKRIFNGRRDEHAIIYNEHGYLTGLGYQLCRFVEYYPIKKTK